MPSKTYPLPGQANQKERMVDQSAWAQVFSIKETVTEIAPEDFTAGGGNKLFSVGKGFISVGGGWSVGTRITDRSAEVA